LRDCPVPGWENPWLRSGLVFAGSNLRQNGTEDGVLTALEASELKLRGPQLVVMSACQTGLGDVANGEGVYGLRRAIALTGAETQVMTLWNVDDKATRYWMASYYAKLKAGGQRSAALRQIQLESAIAISPPKNAPTWNSNGLIWSGSALKPNSNGRNKSDKPDWMPLDACDRSA
jgi:CHAT domain-containing protein